MKWYYERSYFKGLQVFCRNSTCMNNRAFIILNVCFFLSTNNHWNEEIYLFREDQTFEVNIRRLTWKLNLNNCEECSYLLQSTYTFFIHAKPLSCKQPCILIQYYWIWYNICILMNVHFNQQLQYFRREEYGEKNIKW